MSGFYDIKKVHKKINQDSFEKMTYLLYLVLEGLIGG